MTLCSCCKEHDALSEDSICVVCLKRFEHLDDCLEDATIAVKELKHQISAIRSHWQACVSDEAATQTDWMLKMCELLGYDPTTAAGGGDVETNRA